MSGKRREFGVFNRIRQRQSRQSHSERKPDPLDVAEEIQNPNHRRRQPLRIATDFRKMIANRSQQNLSEQQKSPTGSSYGPDGDAASVSSTNAVKSPTPMGPNPGTSSRRTKATPSVRSSKSRSSGVPPYHPSGSQTAENGNNKNTKQRKSRGLPLDSLVSLEDEFRNEMAENNSTTRQATSWSLPDIKVNIPALKSSNHTNKKKSTVDIQDMDGGDWDDKSDEVWLGDMKGVVEAAEKPVTHENTAVYDVDSAEKPRSCIAKNGLIMKKVNNRTKKRPKGKPINTPGSSFKRPRQDAFSSNADNGMHFDPVRGKSYESGRIPRKKKQFGKRTSDSLMGSPRTPDSFVDSPVLRRSKRKKSLKTTNDVIDICSDSDDDNIVVTKNDSAIAKEEECDATKFHLTRLAIGEKVYNNLDHRPRIIFNDAKLEMDIVFYHRANSFDSDPERIRISVADIEDFAYWGKENAVTKPDGLLSFIFIKSGVVTTTMARRNRKNSNNKTIVLEFEEEQHMNDIVELVADNIKAEAIPPDDIEVNAAALIKDSKKPRSLRSKSKSHKKFDEFLFGRKSDDILLVYPFEGDRNSLDAAAEGLMELGWQESSEESEDSVGKKADRKSEPCVFSTAAENTSSENALTTTQNGQRTHFIEIRVEDYERLDTGEWLNDSLVDMWMQWISRHISCKQSSNVHFFTSHFYSTLASEGAEGVRSWTAKKNINIFEKRLIFIPINKTLHWSLCVVVNPGAIVQEVDDEDPPLPCILFFDSLKMHGKRKIRKDVVNWLKAEWERTKEGNVDNIFTNGSFKLYDPQVPRQNNGSDCGVFVCRYALAMFQLRHTRFTRREAGLELLGDEPSTPRSIRRAESRAFEKLITNGHAFDFDVEDIQRIRQDFKTLIQNLHPLYHKVKKVKIQAEKDQKRARKRQKAEATRALEYEQSLKERDNAAKSSSDEAATSNGEAPNEMSDSSSKENCVPSETIQKPNVEARGQEEDLSDSEDQKQQLSSEKEEEEISEYKGGDLIEL